MTNSYTIGAGDGADALSQNQQHRRGDGYGVVDPDSGTAAVSINTGSLGQADTLSVAAGDVLVEGTTHTLTTTDVQIDISNPSDPRRDVVYVDTAGAVQVAKGAAEATQPGDEDLDRFQFFRPTPPDLEGTKATVLAEVWVAADTGSVEAADLNDRRMSALGDHSFDFDPVEQAELDTHEANVSAHHSPVTLDLGDDGSNESTDLSELAVSGTDPNDIFSEPTVDKLLIDPAQNWPAADDVPDSAVDHDATTNYAANEHVDHASVSITAGDGLAGGGDLTATRTLDLALDIEDGGTNVGDGTFWGIDLGTNLSGTDNGDGTVTVDASGGGTTGVDVENVDGTPLVSGATAIQAGTDLSFTDDGDGTATLDSTASGGSAVEVAEDGTSLTTNVTLIDVLGGLTASEPATDEIDLTVDETEVDHDSLQNFVANEHVDHSTVSVSGGSYIDGGGDLTANRTYDFDAIQYLIDHPEKATPQKLEDGQSNTIPIRVEDGETLTVYGWGCYQVTDGTAPTDLDMEFLLDDNTVAHTEHTTWTEDATGIWDETNSSGGLHIYKLQAANDTGGLIDDPGVGMELAYEVA